MLETFIEGYQSFKAFMEDPLFCFAMYQIAKAFVKWIRRNFYF